MALKKIFALVMAGSLAFSLVGCEADDSLPTRPRQPWLNAEKETDNAKKREEEKKGRDLPSDGREFPGQSQAPGSAGGVITAVDTSPKADAPRLPAWGTLPHLHMLSRDQYAAGQTAVPDTDLTIDNSWGQVLPLKQATHRDWPAVTVGYKPAMVNHNPTYFKPLEEADRRLAFFSEKDASGFGSGTVPGAANAVRVVTVPDTTTNLLWFVDSMNYVKDGSIKQFNIDGMGTHYLNKRRYHLGDSWINEAGFSGSYPSSAHVLGFVGSTVLDGAWLMVQGAALPLQFYYQHPWSRVETGIFPVVNDSIYAGQLPAEGAIAPTAYPGQVRWTYPWTRPLGSPPTTGPSAELTEENSRDLRVKPRP